MRLKKLELLGFKSFADKTEVIFDEGVTCIVGPNGCGKSNISDSMRWVLGERSAKMLRGSKMEDVIFNGTDFRKPTAMAEVSLTIDNSDRGLPIDYNEVTITRRLYRSGESEYLINKTVCRLKDIQDLILDTGIGSSSYSMIEQGRIDYILNADADERRFLIEEAAGISKYKVKKEEAIRKLERTEENRLRLNDIIQEVHKNIQYAERQAKRAAKYREELERLKSLEIKKAFIEIKALSEKKSALEEESGRVLAEIASLEQQIAELRTEQARLSDILKETQLKYSQAEAARYALQSKMDQNTQQLRFNQEKKLEMASRIGQIDEETRQLQSQIETTTREISQKEQEVMDLLGEKDRIGSELTAADQALKNIEEEAEGLRRLSDQIKTKSFESAAKTTQLRNEYHRTAAFLENNTQQKKKQEASAARVKLENDAWIGKKGDCEKEISALAAQLEEAQKSTERLAQEKAENLAFHENSKRELEELERLIHEKITRFEMLKELEHASSADEESLIAEVSESQRHLLRSIRHIFRVKSGYEWALETALESYSRSLVADSWEAAESVIEKILLKKTPGIGLFVRDGQLQSRREPMSSAPAHPKILFPLSEAVEIAEGYDPLFRDYLTGIFVTAPLTAPDVRELLPYTMNSWRFVSPDGLMLGPDGKMFCRGAFIDEQSSFKRVSDIEQLEKEIESLRNSSAVKKTEIESSSVRLQELEQEQDQTEARRTDALVRKESFESMRRGMEDRLQSFQRELDLFYFETQELESEYEKASRECQRLEAELALAEEAEKNLRNQTELLSRDFDRIDAQKSAALQNQAEVKARFSGLEDRELLLEESLKIMKDHHARNGKRLAVLEQEKESIQAREQAIRQEDAALEAEQAGLEEKRRQADVELELIRQEKEKFENALEQLVTSLQQAQNRQQEIRGSLHQFEMQLMDLGYQNKTIHERLEQTYRITLPDLNSADYAAEEGEAEKLEEMIQGLKSKVESLGTVNLLAIEEYEELKTRYDFLMGQQKDLEDAREQLLETIRKINKTTKGLFEETFTNVQKMFQEYYQTLFRGGSAKLVLVDETNPLESGIDIVVRPPGKKLTHISLLSGGEKALTAIALLFALFKIKPSPFCVLDEVDAPLDEANVDRFLAVLKSFLVKSQFIIVTHNRKTIAMGDALYGVTMQEAGVSKLVSVKVNTDAKAALATHPAAATEETKAENSESSEVHA